jgi:hypothetical protein
VTGLFNRELSNLLKMYYQDPKKLLSQRLDYTIVS